MDLRSLAILMLIPVGTLILYFIAESKYRNAIGLAGSLAFLGYLQLNFLPGFILFVIINYGMGLILGKHTNKPSGQVLLWIFCLANIATLVFFKTLLVYPFVEIPSWLPSKIPAAAGPIGISYLVFQVVSYLIDINQEEAPAEKNIINFAFYLLLFPKIMSGPIIRYTQIAAQLVNKTVAAPRIAQGLRRFIIGAAKKVIIADVIGRVITPALDMGRPDFTTGVAWLCLIGYALQIYYDFSGFTDMAIGAGQMMGLTFPENFNYPYTARSVSEFWRRWHMTLSGWFRKYVFMPLEYQFRYLGKIRQPLNILIVFLLTGLWHGLTLNFAIWGLLHGGAIVLEDKIFGKRPARWMRIPQHIFTLAVLLVSWVFFRTATPEVAVRFLGRLVGYPRPIYPVPVAETLPFPIFDHSFWIAMALGLIFALPVVPALQKICAKIAAHFHIPSPVLQGVYDLCLLIVLFYVLSGIASSTMVATIYGKF